MTVAQPAFVFLIEDGFAMLPFTSAIEVLRLANKLMGGINYRYWVSSLGDMRVVASNGVGIDPSRPIGAMGRDDRILVVSGDGVCHSRNTSLASFLHKAARHGHEVWGLSSGVVRLAQAGLLSGHTVSAHWEDIPYLEQNFPGITVTSSLFTFGQTIATCAGGLSAADLMLSHIRATGPATLAEEISARLILDGTRAGRVAQKLPTRLKYRSSTAKVQLALELMDAFMDEPLSVSEIAAKVAVSQRQLERLFMADLGKTPKQLYLELRLESARYDVLVSTRPITSIGLDYGFNPNSFARNYMKMFGITPKTDRQAARKLR
jgi:transcriptional regulator GlxA family with amidase domain